jgi:hypothetical protein
MIIFKQTNGFMVIIGTKFDFFLGDLGVEAKFFNDIGGKYLKLLKSKIFKHFNIANLGT